MSLFEKKGSSRRRVMTWSSCSSGWEPSQVLVTITTSGVLYTTRKWDEVRDTDRVTFISDRKNSECLSNVSSMVTKVKYLVL